MNSNTITELGYDNCKLVRVCGEAVYAKDVSPRTGTCYKADDMSELAPHSEALSSVSKVKHGVVHRNYTFLLGEASMGGMGWFKSTAKAVAVDAVMRQPVPIEESAESIVIVAPESASSCQRDTRSAKSAATQIR
ncbi:MAG: hypothetical protein ACSHX8_12400 [Opitutaceae bacterium]